MAADITSNSISLRKALRFLIDELIVDCVSHKRASTLKSLKLSVIFQKTEININRHTRVFLARHDQNRNRKSSRTRRGQPGPGNSRSLNLQFPRRLQECKCILIAHCSHQDEKPRILWNRLDGTARSSSMCTTSRASIFHDRLRLCNVNDFVPSSVLSTTHKVFSLRRKRVCPS